MAAVAAIRSILTRAVGLSAAALAVSAAAAPAPLHEAFMGGHLADKPTGPPAARYQTDEGAVFVLDRSTPRTLLKFENDPEIWVLDRANGPRGDVIYRNDLGEEMLRATRLGGVTVFTMRRPEGSPAALDGATQPLHIGAVSPTQLATEFYQASVRASRFARHEIVFETGKDADVTTAGELADAAAIASEAIVDVAARPNGRLILARINDVVITQGGKPNAALQKNRLIVTIVPKDGLGGRPSSRRIERAAGAP
jgi:Domain of unknown function (DUF4908)